LLPPWAYPLNFQSSISEKKEKGKRGCEEDEEEKKTGLIYNVFVCDKSTIKYSHTIIYYCSYIFLIFFPQRKALDGVTGCGWYPTFLF
jgi:hypothetical protein